MAKGNQEEVEILSLLEIINSPSMVSILQNERVRKAGNQSLPQSIYRILFSRTRTPHPANELQPAIQH